MKIISPVKLKNGILIDWKRKTLTDLVNEVRPQIKGKTLGGYSIGGAVALILAQELNITKLVLYSPTPLFKETLSTFSNNALKVIGKKRLADAKKYSIKKIADNIKIPVKIYVGEKEKNIKLEQYLQKRLVNSSLTVKKGLTHNNLLNT